jgi:hypothetical protein
MLFSTGNRIFHKRQDLSLLQVDYDPILTDQVFDCTDVNNCTGQGECVRPNGCRCNSGWAGNDCSAYDCAGVSFCSGNGDCIGPNKCSCLQGWTGDACVTATCHGQNNCSAHGFCVLPEMCTCFIEYAGDDCSRCAHQRWGNMCRPCPSCVHGSCKLDTGKDLITNLLIYPRTHARAHARLHALAHKRMHERKIHTYGTEWYSGKCVYTTLKWK